MLPQFSFSMNVTNPRNVCMQTIYCYQCRFFHADGTFPWKREVFLSCLNLSFQMTADLFTSDVAT